MKSGDGDDSLSEAKRRPVSYTHLDVYKRQTLTSFVFYLNNECHLKFKVLIRKYVKFIFVMYY